MFVLGVYASAVHAKWLGEDNKTKVQALAVASEPYIFWRGDKAEDIIEQIEIPKSLGKIIPAHKQFNGPSGKALDEMILEPLGLDRSDVWLCDLVPHSCLNPNQRDTIKEKYEPLIQEFNLPIPSVPPPPTRLADEVRRAAILDELIKSKANTLVLLGDQPIRWFLKYFDKRWKKLSDFSQNEDSYGQLHSTQIKSKTIKLLPLAHPRQIAKLGQSTAKWYEYHQTWISKSSSDLLGNG